MSDPRTKPPRRIACVRCRRTKKKCDHAVPTCGQCSRAGVECRQLRTQRTGDYITVPLSYYQHLEVKARSGDGAPNVNGSSPSPNPPFPANNAAQAWPPDAGVPPTPPSVESCGARTPDISMVWNGSSSDRASLGGQGNMCAAEPEFQHASLTDTNQTWSVLQNTSNTDEPDSVILSGSGAAPAVSNDIEPMDDLTDASLDITWVIEMYANVYLAHIHKMYPFLHEESVRGWMRTCSRGQLLEGCYKGFILRMVCAVGAFMCSSFSKDCSHLQQANSLTQEALTKFHSDAMRHNRVIRSQVCLLRVLHAIYGADPGLIQPALASALIECALLLEQGDPDQEFTSEPASRPQSDSEAADDTGDSDEQIKQIILACHQANEIIASGWHQQEDDSIRLLADKLSTYSDRLLTLHTPSSTPTHLHPFHKIRRIQNKIRLFHDAAERWGLDREAKNKWKADIVQDVEDWRTSLNQVEDDDGVYAPSSNDYTQKVYDYTICLLHEADPSSMVVGDLYALLAASSDACRKFRATQRSNKGIILRNWNALVMQFRVGILLLYCFWATPANLRTPTYSSVETAVKDCSETLSSFAKRWPQAEVFYHTFTCLATQTPFDVVDEGVQVWKFPQEDVTKMESLMERLKELRTHKTVLAIIEAIVRWPPIPQPDNNDSFIASIELDPMNLFELGQAAYGGELLYFDM